MVTGIQYYYDTAWPVPQSVAMVAEKVRLGAISEVRFLWSHTQWC